MDTGPLSSASAASRVQVPVFHDETDFQLLCLTARLFQIDAGVGIFGGKNGFPGIDEWEQLAAPTLVETVLGEGPIEVGQQVFHLFGNVLEPDGKAPDVSFIGQLHIVFELVIIRQRKPAVGLVTVNIVRLNSVKSLCYALVQPAPHDGRQ